MCDTELLHHKIQDMDHDTFPLCMLDCWDSLN